MPDTFRFTVLDADDGARLDQVLARGVPGLSRRRARVLIDIGGVFVDRARVKVAGRVLRAGQVIETTLGGALDRATEAPVAPPPLVVVYQDDHLVVVDKPAGLVTAPTPESDRGDLLDQLAQRGDGPVFLVHRLDRPTSGLLVFARSRDANRVLADKLVAHDVEREYLAVVDGAFPASIATIDRPLRGQRAVTHVVARTPIAGGRATELRVRLETGRTHQIRLHLADVGHPVLGDGEHGSESSRRFRPRPPRLALHATVLGFAHPITSAPMRWECPWPDDVAPWVATLRTEVPP